MFWRPAQASEARQVPPVRRCLPTELIAVLRMGDGDQGGSPPFLTEEFESDGLSLPKMPNRQLLLTLERRTFGAEASALVSNPGKLPGGHFRYEQPHVDPPPWYDLPEIFKTCPHCCASTRDVTYSHLTEGMDLPWKALDGWMGR